MRHLLVVFASIMIAFLESVKSAFGHGVHCGITGCPVGASGINDFHLTQTAFDNTLYFSIILCGIIMVLFWSSTLKRKPISTMPGQ